jgi:hypothetical protein
MDAWLEWIAVSGAGPVGLSGASFVWCAWVLLCKE